jgi:hypothetical protein
MEQFYRPATPHRLLLPATTARSAANSFFPQADDQRLQEEAKIDDGNGESIWCGFHTVAA